MENESGLDNEEEYLYSIAADGWSEWTEDKRNFVCYKFGIEYDKVIKYIANGSV